MTTAADITPLAERGNPSALLTGGKSGGHVFPALAIADELKARGWGIGFVGTREGMEARLARERGLRFFDLAALPVVGRGLLARLRALVLLLRSSLQARDLVRRLRPSVVVGTGGFVSVPAALGGWMARRPLVLVEPNARAGAANRGLSRFARAAAVAFEETASQLRCSCWLTGVPVRRSFFEQPAPTAPEGVFRLLVLGGSQGARRLNEALPAVVDQVRSGLASGTGLALLHQTGEAHFESTRELYRTRLGELEGLAERGIELRLQPFVDDVAAELGACHLVISRAGAITVSEICAAGRGSILVPLTLAGGHQTDNARALERAGACRVVDDAVAGEQLAAELLTLVDSPETLVEMGRRARELARPDASRSIADHLERLVDGGSER